MKSAVGSLQYCAPEADKGELPMSRMDSTEMWGFPCFNQNSATLPSGSPGPTGRPLDGWLQIRILLRLRFVPLAAVLAAEGGRIPGSFIGSWYFDCREGHGGRICPHTQQPRWSLGVCTYVMLCGKPPVWGCVNQQLKMMKKATKGMVQQIGVPHFFMGNIIWESDGT